METHFLGELRLRIGRFVTFWNSGGRIGCLRGPISGSSVCVIVDQVLALGLYRCIGGGGASENSWVECVAIVEIVAGCVYTHAPDHLTSM